MNVSRREFLQLLAGLGISAALPESLIQKALAGNADPRVIWLQGQGCSGCSISLLNSINITTIDDVLLNYVNMEYNSTIIASAGELAFAGAIGTHPTASELASLGDDWLSTDLSDFDLNTDGRVNLIDFAKLASQGFTLVVEGAIPIGADGSFCGVGAEIMMIEAFDRLSDKADQVIAYGTCAAFGGIPAGSPNPTSAVGVQDVLDYLGRTKTVINIPGCPSHPDWFVGTLVTLLSGEPVSLDAYGRPSAYFGQTIHDACSNLSAFSANFAPEMSHARGRACLLCHSPNDHELPDPTTLGEQGCLFALGCKGRATHGDCPTRKWNSPAQGQAGVNWCIGARTPCIGCTEPNFPDGMAPFHING
jgi:hydrogenase small subunit